MSLSEEALRLQIVVRAVSRLPTCCLLEAIEMGADAIGTQKAKVLEALDATAGTQTRTAHPRNTSQA